MLNNEDNFFQNLMFIGFQPPILFSLNLAGEGSKWVHNINYLSVKNHISPRINSTVLSFPTLKNWPPPFSVREVSKPLQWPSKNQQLPMSPAYFLFLRLRAQQHCEEEPSHCVTIQQPDAVSFPQTGSSTIATVNCFSLLLRQSQATHTLSDDLIKHVLLFSQNHLWNMSALCKKNRKRLIPTLSISSRSHRQQTSGVPCMCFAIEFFKLTQRLHAMFFRPSVSIFKV